LLSTGFAGGADLQVVKERLGHAKIRGRAGRVSR
jgi:hypothetical protein